MRKIIFLLLLTNQLLYTQQNKLAKAALELTKQKVTYDPSYFSIKYPNGSIDTNTRCLFYIC